MATPSYHVEANHIVPNPYYHHHQHIPNRFEENPVSAPVLHPYWEQSVALRAAESGLPVGTRMTPWVTNDVTPQQFRHHEIQYERAAYLQTVRTPTHHAAYYANFSTAEQNGHGNIYIEDHQRQQLPHNIMTRQTIFETQQPSAAVFYKAPIESQVPPPLHLIPNAQITPERQQCIMEEEQPKQSNYSSYQQHLPHTRRGRTRGQSNQNGKEFQCPLCHKQYCRKSTLKAHLRQHSGERPYLCQVCGKTFSQAANLTAHKRVHTGEKPFSCPICMRPFSQSSSLVTHKRTHTGERPYQCAHCDKAFTDSSTLTKHMRTHTGHKPYECPICFMRFTQSGNLHRHMKTHRE